MAFQRNRFVEELLPIIQEKPKTWIEVVLHDTKGKPVPGERYRLKLPNGAIHEGNLDAQGLARVERIEPGNVHVSFPDLDDEDWHSA